MSSTLCSFQNKIDKERIESTKKRHQTVINYEEKNEDRSKTNKNVCIICYRNEIDSAVYPCGHYQFCLYCLDKHFKTNHQCPSCRCKTNQYMKLFK